MQQIPSSTEINGIYYSLKWAFPSEHLVSLRHLAEVWVHEVWEHRTATPAAP